MGGVDKTVLRVGHATLLDHVLAAADPICACLVVVGPVRPTQLERVVFTLEAEPGGGPVPGVAVGMAETGGAEELFVLAADLPLLSTDGLERLLTTRRRHDAPAAAAAGGKGHPNPLLAVYRQEDLRLALERLGTATRNVPASRLLPPGSMTVPLDLRETLNVNTPADVAAAAAAIRGMGS